MSSPIIIQSHRGAGRLAPDNTMAAFELGWSLGTIPEADVRTTSDGVVVAFHDNVLEKIAVKASDGVRKLSIADLSWAEVEKLDVGSWKAPRFAGERVPRLDAVFAAMQGRPERMLYLDVKDISLEQVAGFARYMGVLRQVILASTNWEILREWSALAPESGTLMWMGDPEPRRRERLAEFHAAGLRGITQLQFHVRLVDLAADEPFDISRALFRETAKELRTRGVLFQALPLNTSEPTVYHRLMDLGVESFASDDPKVAIAAMRSYKPR